MDIHEVSQPGFEFPFLGQHRFFLSLAKTEICNHCISEIDLYAKQSYWEVDSTINIGSIQSAFGSKTAYSSNSFLMAHFTCGDCGK